jgi:hypothetical protein
MYVIFVWRILCFDAVQDEAEHREGGVVNLRRLRRGSSNAVQRRAVDSD